MFSYEDRMLAVKTYYKCNKNLIAVYNELGYPSPNALRGWINEYETNRNLHKNSRKKPRYTQEQIDKAVSFCLSHDNNISNTVKVLGYPSRMILAKWMQEHGYFDKCIKPSCQKKKKTSKIFYRTKKTGVVRFVERDARLCGCCKIWMQHIGFRELEKNYYGRKRYISK